MKLGKAPLQRQVLSEPRQPRAGPFALMAVGRCCDGSVPPQSCFPQKRRSPSGLLLEENLTDENEAKPDQLVKLRSFHEGCDIAGGTRFAVQLSPSGLR